jgi:hypothetical protein
MGYIGRSLVGLFYFLSTWCWLCNLLTKHWRELSWIKWIVLLVIWVGSGYISLACKRDWLVNSFQSIVLFVFSTETCLTIKLQESSFSRSHQSVCPCYRSCGYSLSLVYLPHYLYMSYYIQEESISAFLGVGSGHMQFSVRSSVCRAKVKQSVILDLKCVKPGKLEGDKLPVSKCLVCLCSVGWHA